LDTLIIRSLQGLASPAEERRLRRWREKSEENETQYREIATILELCRSLPDIATSPPPDARTLIARAGDEVEDDAA